mgnify:CR=1 FL=1
MKLEKELQARANLFFYERMFIVTESRANRACIKKNAHTYPQRKEIF